MADESILANTLAAGLYDKPPTLQPTSDKAEARRVAEDFEALFLSQVLNSLFAGIETDGPFGGGSAEKVYRALLNQEYGRLLSRAGGIGIADAVQHEILKLQEVD